MEASALQKALQKGVRSFVEKILKTIFPFQCPLCFSLVESRGLCPKCWSKLDFIRSPVCGCCGKPFEYESGSELCSRCLHDTSIEFSSHQSLFRYTEHSKRLIFRLKHTGDQSVVPLFVHLMAPLALTFQCKINFVIPVPLHWTRLASRRFNQSALLAKGVAKALQKPYISNGLKRIKKTPSQGRFNRIERIENVKDAFDVSHRKKLRLEGKTVLLIDDVYTTGATLNACACALKRKGVKCVYALTFAKVISK